jgi:hypothetical protein
MAEEKERAWWLAPGYANINYRRAVEALGWIRAYPGKSAWELSSISGIVYADMSKGLQKGREYGLFRVESEERDQGGIRYRYWASDSADAVLEDWAAKGNLKEPVP